MEPEIKNLPQYSKIAKLASEKAGDFLMKNFRKHSPNAFSYKKHHEIVTTADKRANEIIVKIIKTNFPNHNIVSEEAEYKKTKSPFCWYIDPLDGTSNYTAGSPLFAVNIGLVHNNEIILGIINLPYMKEIYWTMKDHGAFCNGKRIHVSKTKNLKQSFIQICHAYRNRDRLIGTKIVARVTGRCRVYRGFGCAGVEHANVAAGRADASVIAGSRSWDNLAGALLIREAGGKVTDFKNKEWDVKSADFMASNGKIHNQLLETIK
ncbi:inositol monophosphatase [Patescibacteria group bacterium]|nr:inositol monophosphatase [Patescibacteria group bacterium]MBU1922112.1 inositol monophosphatase [Patescibacteria group bacterium]